MAHESLSKRPPGVYRMLRHWNAAISRVQPAFRRFSHKVRTRRGLRDILQRRHQIHLHGLDSHRRKLWLDRRVEKLWRMPVEERLYSLFIKTKVHEHDQGFTLYLVDEDGHRIRDLANFSPQLPCIVLKGLSGEKVLPISLPLHQIQGHVLTFVNRARRIFKIKAPRGRKPGFTGQTPGDAAVTMLLALLAESHHVRSADLLRLVDRDVSTQNYRWLKRRLALGGQLLAKDSDFTRRLKSMEKEHVLSLLRMMQSMGAPPSE